MAGPPLRRGVAAAANPVAAARRPARAHARASSQRDELGRPYRSFRGLLAHLATLTRNQVRFAGTQATVPILAEPTADQRSAFELISAAIPLARGLDRVARISRSPLSRGVVEVMPLLGGSAR